MDPPHLKESQSHIIDHVRTFESDDDPRRIALEIEWNNKDPFFDRDLENFKRLHADGAISLVIIVTRGSSLQASMRNLVERFLRRRAITSFSELAQWRYRPTARQEAAIRQAMQKRRDPTDFARAFSDKFVSDKFGQATTHWSKLQDRVRRGVGNPCPLVLIGLPDSIVSFDEGQAALVEVMAKEDAADVEVSDER